MIRALTLLGALGVSSCAAYAPSPLSAPEVVLAKPVAGVLEARAGAIERPWLKPGGVDLAAPLHLDGVAALAVVNNPDLLALRARYGVADAQAFAAGLLPDPSFHVGVDRVVSGPDALLNLAGALGFDLNALRTRAVTRARATAQALQVRLDLAWAEWQTAGQAQIQAVRVAGLSKVVALARESQVLASSQLERSRRAAARGDVPVSEAETARIAAYDAGERLRTGEQDLQSARLELTRLLGLPPGTEIALADMPLPGALPPAEELLARAKQSRGDLAALRAGYAAQEANVHLAVLQQFPSLNLTVNGNRDSAGNLLIGPAVDFTLPLWNRNRGGIAIERATRDALKAEYDARLFQTRAEIVAAANGVALNRRQLEQAQLGLASLEQQAAAGETAARRGDLSLAASAGARQQLLDRRSIIERLELAIREQTIALELLSGAPVEEWE